jgi:asparagine N-glycosylation enzyme membrane subunit Stt3
MPEARKEPTFRDWFRSNRSTVLILLGIFLLAFTLRSYLYYQVSFDTWPPQIVGNDPSYHQRVINYVQEEKQHLRIDDLLNYPLSGGNPRPPLFDWSIVLFGYLLAPIFGMNVENSTWYAFQFAPVIWGALSVIPVYLLGKHTFGRRAGLMAAFFLALTASHIERSTLGFTDHDSMVVFFVILTFYFLARAFKVQRDDNYIKDWRQPQSVVLGFRSFLGENKQAVLYALMAGLSMTAIALTWQGFAYVLAIMLIYYIVQLLIQRFRNEDSLGTFMVIFIAMATVVLLSLPYYHFFSISTWSQGFYILLAMTALGVFIVPTRDIPWLLVLPTLVLFGAISFLLLSWRFPATADMLFTGGGYFIKSKLYSTIAEAQAPDISRIVFIYGPATFFMALGGVVLAVVKIPSNLRKDYMVIVTWTLVAIFMSLSAIRFNFNATPAFALLAGWVLIELVMWMKAEGLSIAYSIVAVIIMLLGIGIVAEGWGGFFAENYILLTVGPVILGSLAYFAIMKYRKHRDYFQFRKVVIAVLVGFVVMMPNVFLAVDAAIPIESKRDYDPDLKYLGSFGSSLHSDYWMDSYTWLSQQDLVDMDGNFIRPEDRPAFMSWWDYGFDQLLLGEHPTAADNFQNGYQFTGSMIASQNETEAISLMNARLLEGDFVQNGGKFSKEVWDVLVDHLGGDRNSTTSAFELVRIYRDPSKYTSKVEKNPDLYGSYTEITPANAKYAAARGVMLKLGEEGNVDLYHHVRTVTGKSLRYFAVDYRLFPFSSSNTGIFYAPIKLADRVTEDYLENKVYAEENTRGSNEKPEWTAYPDNPITMDKARSESERLGYKFRITKYDMFYTEKFYNSLFYRTYIGQSPKDLGKTNDGKSVPGMFGDIQSIPPMQAWNMTHFKLVYRTMYYSEEEEANASFPDDYVPMNSDAAIDIYQKNGGDLKSGLGQGVFYIKYYDGLQVKGRVRTERGVGVPGVRVTVLDESGIPHGSMMTGPKGDYELIAPPGEATIVVSTGDLTSDYDHLYQFQVDQSTGQPANPLNITQLAVSDEQAMRLVDDGRKELDLIISGKTVSGKVYWDLNSDSSFTEEDDDLVTKGNISFALSGSSTIRYGPYGLGEEGTYSIEDLVPGRYNIEFTIGSRTEVLISDFVVDPKESGERDIKLENTMVKGQVRSYDTAPFVNSSLLLKGQDGSERSISIDAFGNYSEPKVFPGIYSLTLDDEGFFHEPVMFEIGQSDNLAFDLTIYPRADLEVTAKMGTTNRAASGAVLRLTEHHNVTVRSYVLDQKGRASISVPAGQYDMHIYSMERGAYMSYIGSVVLGHEDLAKVEVRLIPSVRVNGSLTRVVTTAFNDTLIRFTRMSDGQEAYGFTALNGAYSIILPRSDYHLMVNNRTSGNNTFIQIQDLDLRFTDNDVTLDIWTPQAIHVKGMVYWDKDANSRFTPIGGTESVLGGTIQLAEDKELPGVEIIFRFSNGTLRATSDDEGSYSVYLPPGQFNMEVRIDGFEPFNRQLPVSGSNAEQNYGINDTDAMMRAVPRDVLFNLSSRYYGKEGITYQPVRDLELTLTSLDPHRGGESLVLKTAEDGTIFQELVPGLYDVRLVEEANIDGLVHDYELGSQLLVEPGSALRTFDLDVKHTVDLTGQLYFIENDLLRYPVEMTVNFNAIKGERVTIASVQTDFNGQFYVTLPSGEYILEAHEDRPATHYMYLDVISASDASGPLRIRMVQGFPLDGSISPDFNGIEDSEVFLEWNGLWTSTGIRSDGTFTIFLLDGPYQVNYTFETEGSGIGGGSPVLFQHTSEIVMDGPLFGAMFELETFVEVTGAVYYDVNGDRTVDTQERLYGTNITFTPVNGDKDPVTVTSNVIGDYKAIVPLTELRISVDLIGFQTSPRSDMEFLDLAGGDIPLRDVPVVPEDVPVEVLFYEDTDGDGSSDPKEPRQVGMEVLMVDASGREFEAVTDEGGLLTIDLPPGNYIVKGMRFLGGQPVSGFLGELDVNLGDDLTGLEWAAVKARRFAGTLFYKDTLGATITTLPATGKIEFRTDDGGLVEVPHNGRTFSVDLPYYTYSASCQTTTKEFGLTMTYSLSKRMTVNETTSMEDFSMELKKVKDHSFSLNLVNDAQHVIEMGAGETVRLVYSIRNTGNEPISVDISVEEKPEGWTVDLPLATGIELAIGAQMERQVNISTPKAPDSQNDIKITGKSAQNTQNTFQVQVKTAPSYKFDILFDAPAVFGVGYNEERVFNVTVQNLGTGEDVVLLHVSPELGSISGWQVRWEGEDEFPTNGLNVSLSPLGVRRFAVTVNTPFGGNDSAYNERLTLTFQGRNRLGDTVSKSITLRTVRANLVVPSGFLKLTNRRLTDPVLGKTIEANISVMSLSRDASNVKVALKVDNRLVGNGTILYIPQNGIASTKVQFDIDNLNISEDDFHTFEVFIDPDNTVRESDDFDNLGVWYNIVIGNTPEDQVEINWKIIIFIVLVVLGTLGIIAYRQRTNPI